MGQKNNNNKKRKTIVQIDTDSIDLFDYNYEMDLQKLKQMNLIKTSIMAIFLLLTF